MIVLSDVRLYSYTLTSIHVHWLFDDTIEPVSDYSLNIYRTGYAPQEDYADNMVKVASGIAADDYAWEDLAVGTLATDQWSDLYYSVEVENISSGATSALSTPTRFKSIADPFAKVIIWEKQYGYKLTGRPTAIYKKRNSGTYCTNYDMTLGRHTEGNCTECYDSGYQEGYYPPIVINTQINAAPKRTIQQEFGEWQPSEVILYCPPYPVLEPHDVVVDFLNRRWEVLQVRPTMKGLATISQQARMDLIPKNDIRYSMPEIDLSTYYDKTKLYLG